MVPVRPVLDCESKARIGCCYDPLERWKYLGVKVFVLQRNEHGHPDAEGFWEQHCEKAATAVGFDFQPD